MSVDAVSSDSTDFQTLESAAALHSSSKLPPGEADTASLADDKSACISPLPSLSTAPACVSGASGRPDSRITLATAVSTMSLRSLPSTSSSGGAYCSSANSQQPMTPSSRRQTLPPTRRLCSAPGAASKMASTGARQRAHDTTTARTPLGAIGSFRSCPTASLPNLSTSTSRKRDMYLRLPISSE
eukprot:5060362-Pleurochrysis_carterae.AAC.2